MTKKPIEITETNKLWLTESETRLAVEAIESVIATIPLERLETAQSAYEKLRLRLEPHAYSKRPSYMR